MRSLLFFALVAGCSSSSPTTVADAMDMDGMDIDAPAEDVTPTETGAAAAATIHVGNYYYKPSTVTVKVGDTVEWVWDGGTHTVTSGSSCTKDGKFDSDVHTTKNYKFRQTFTEAGTFPFFCDFMDHCTSKNQTGTVTVE